MLFTGRSTKRLTVLVAALGLLLAACGADDADDGAGPAAPVQPAEDDVGGEVEDVAADEDAAGIHVVVTTSILGDIVAHLVDDDGEVTVIMPPGADPHGFQPSAADAAALRDADLVVANGLQLEENLVAALDAAEEDGVEVLRLAEQLDPIEFDWEGPHDHGHGDDHEHDHGHDHDDHGQDQDAHDHGDHDHDDDDHDHGPQDPHVWFDPMRMTEGVRIIAAEIAAVDERLEASEWEQRAETYVEQLLAVHAELEERFAAIPDDRRMLVTNHDALGYLAHRYGFEVLGTVIPGASTQAEADPQGFAELIRTVEDAGVTVVFAENTDSTRLAEQLASEVVGRADLEVEVVRIYTDALGEPGSGAETYLGLLRTTGVIIADALTDGDA